MSNDINIIGLLDSGLLSIDVHKYIRDPIHVYIPFTKIEELIIDSEIFQRLRRIHQLQIAYTVYPGATHSRFLHSIGVMHLAGKFGLALLRSSYGLASQQIPSTTDRASFRVPSLEELGLSDKYEIISVLMAVRIGGLLHDVGHMPYSHAFDEAIISRSPSIKSKGIFSHEDTSYYIYKNFIRDKLVKSIREHLNESNINEDTIIGCLDYIMASKHKLEKPHVPIYHIMRHVVKEFVYPADIVDFCMRDSYFTGAVEYGRIDADRLFIFSMIVGRCERDVEKTGLHIGLLRKAVGALRAFLYSRIWLFNHVYFHKFSRLMDYTVKQLLMEMYDREVINFEELYCSIVSGNDEAIRKLEKLDDGYILYKALESNHKKIRELARRILYRKPHLKEVYSQEITIRFEDLEGTDRIKETFEDVIKQLKETISDILTIDSSEIIIDSPPIKFFPLNPYLPYSVFPLIDAEKHKIVAVHEANAWMITGARITDFTIFRVLIPRDTLSRVGLPDDKLRRKISSVMTKDFMETIKKAFIVKYSKYSYEVTM